ncbi:MAG: NADPH-dependent F420 reductase [Candidatus Odinarchaeia archaeon]
MVIAKDVISQEFNIVKLGTKISEAYKLVKESNVDTTIVVDKNNRVVGVLTTWNYLRAKVLGWDNYDIPVDEVMSFPVITAYYHDDVKDIAEKMMIHRIKNVVIVDKNNRLIGVISANAILECEELKISEQERMEIERKYTIAIIGGTGKQGRGLALRWAKAGHKILIGSRDPEKAKMQAKELTNNLEAIGVKPDLSYGSNQEVAREAEIIVLAIPYESVEGTILGIKDGLSPGKIIISPIVPLSKEGKYVRISNSRISAAEMIDLMTKVLGVKTVAAFHTIPARNLSRVEDPLNFDVVVCSDDVKAKEIVMNLVSHIPNLRPLDGGELKNAVILEYLTSLAINIGRLYRKPGIGLKFV